MSAAGDWCCFLSPEKRPLTALAALLSMDSLPPNPFFFFLPVDAQLVLAAADGAASGVDM